LAVREGSKEPADGISSRTRQRSDFGDHLQTYRAFKRYGLIFVAHVALVLVLLANFFWSKMRLSDIPAFDEEGELRVSLATAGSWDGTRATEMDAS
jgi:hypothetical protein